MEQIDLTFMSNMSNRTSIKLLLFRIHLLGCDTSRQCQCTQISTFLCRIQQEGHCLCRMWLHEHLLSFSMRMCRVIGNRLAVEEENFESSLFLLPSTLQSSLYQSLFCFECFWWISWLKMKLSLVSRSFYLWTYLT